MAQMLQTMQTMNSMMVQLSQTFSHSNRNTATVTTPSSIEHTTDLHTNSADIQSVLSPSSTGEQQPNPPSAPQPHIAAVSTTTGGENILPLHQSLFNTPAQIPDANRGRPVAHAPPRLSHRVDEPTKLKIKNNEFVDFRTLLDPYYPHCLPSNDAQPMQLQICSVQGTPQFYLTPPKSKPLSYEEWEDAWHIFSDVYGTAYPHEYPNLLQYHADVKAIANSGKDWEFYDVAYRKARVADPLPWDTVRPHIHSEAKSRWSPNPPSSFVPPSLNPPSRHSRESGNSASATVTSHSQYPANAMSQSNQPFRASRSASGARQKPSQQQLPPNPDYQVPKGYCFAFHLPGQRCEEDRDCKYKHSCPRCPNRYHPLFKCTKPESIECSPHQELPSPTDPATQPFPVQTHDTDQPL